MENFSGYVFLNGDNLKLSSVKWVQYESGNWDFNIRIGLFSVTGSGFSMSDAFCHAVVKLKAEYDCLSDFEKCLAADYRRARGAVLEGGLVIPCIMQNCREFAHGFSV